MIEGHHLHRDRPSGTPLQDIKPDDIDVCALIQRGSRKFLPLVRNELALKCALKFLRKEEPGRLIQEGDLDNRLKTLFDALAVPDDQQIVEDDSIADPIYCLLENDALITGCAIETHRLLSRPGASKREVHLLIEVDVRVTQARYYYHPFLGD